MSSAISTVAGHARHAGGAQRAHESRGDRDSKRATDDIGRDNISAYSLGMMGYQTPNLDRLAKEGALFTDSYAQQSCTARRKVAMLLTRGSLRCRAPEPQFRKPIRRPQLTGKYSILGAPTGRPGSLHQEAHLGLTEPKDKPISSR